MDKEKFTGTKTPAISILPPRRWVSLELKELIIYRDLLFILAWRDIKVRYKQTILGAAWAILQPFLTMVVFSIFFGRLAGVPSDGLPYPVFTYAALLPWQLFVHALNESSNSLVANQQLITKVYFPRLVIPLAPIIAGLLDFFIAFIVLIIMMLFYKIHITITILILPFLIILAIAVALAVGLWLSALNVEYRDVRYTIPFLVQFWMFLTPIAYPASMVPEKLRMLYGLNPMVGVVEGFRWALLGTNVVIGPLTLMSLVVTGVLLISGLYYFRRMEDNFADVV